MTTQIHSHQLNRKTVTGILITWKSGSITCIQKTPATMDMLVYEFDDIEEVTFIDMIIYDDQPAIDTKTDSKPQQSRGTGGFRYIGTFDKSIESFIQENQNNDQLEIGDTVLINDVSYKCTSIDPLEFEMVARSGGAPVPLSTNSITDPILGHRFVETDCISIDEFVENASFKKSAKVGDLVCINDVYYICTSVNPIQFLTVSTPRGDQ